MNKDKFLVYKVRKDVLEEWLKTIYELTGLENLDHAVEVALYCASSEEERRKIYTVAEILRLEASGRIIPPYRMYEMYEKVVKSLSPERNR